VVASAFIPPDESTGDFLSGCLRNGPPIPPSHGAWPKWTTIFGVLPTYRTQFDLELTKFGMVTHMGTCVFWGSATRLHIAQCVARFVGDSWDSCFYNVHCRLQWHRKHFKTRNKSITSKATQYRQDIVTRMPIKRMELITNSIVTIRSIFAFWKISYSNLRFLWRHVWNV